jgi:hypothetical protein
MVRRRIAPDLARDQLATIARPGRRPARRALTWRKTGPSATA